MPSKSPAQHKFMEAIAHDPGFAKKAGVPQSVGKDFAKAGDAAGITKDKRKAHMAKRRGHGLSIREIAKEFGTSKSSAHRALKTGYVAKGKA